MRSPKLLMAVILTLVPSSTVAQHPEEPVELCFQRLQSQSAADMRQASEQLVRQGKSDPKAREYIAIHLPALIEKGPKDYLGRWITFVRIAGELKIAGSAPALAKWLTIDNIGEISTAGFMRLENNPARAALVQIGDPAIQAVRTVFDNGTLRERRYAVYVWLPVQLVPQGFLRTRRINLIQHTSSSEKVETWISPGSLPVCDMKATGLKAAGTSDLVAVMTSTLTPRF